VHGILTFLSGKRRQDAALDWSDVAFIILSSQSDSSLLRVELALTTWITELNTLRAATDIVMPAFRCKPGAILDRCHQAELKALISQHHPSGSLTQLHLIVTDPVPYNSTVSFTFLALRWVTLNISPKRYFFHIDDDTYVHPSRFLSFMRALDHRVDYRQPLNFGSVSDAGNSLCYWWYDGCFAQGGSGYGLSAGAIPALLAGEARCMAAFQARDRSFLRRYPGEAANRSRWGAATDLVIGQCIQLLFSTPVIHCASFESSNPAQLSTEHLEGSVTLHRLKLPLGG